MAPFFSNPVQINDVEIHTIDLTDYNKTRELFAEVHPDAVIHTAAASNPDRCQLDSDTSRRINVNASINIAALSAEIEIPCVFTSSDLVFDGTNPPYSETDQPNPVSIYGEQKVETELRMKEIHDGTIICRVPLLYGNSGSASAKTKPASGIQTMITTIMSGNPVSLFTDEFRTPASGRSVAAGILLAIENHMQIVHLGGPQRISRYEFGVMIADIFEFPMDLLTPCLQADIEMPAPRPSDVSLNSSKAFALGYNPGSPIEELRHMRTTMLTH